VLHLHRAERADRLVAALADVLVAPLDDPFATELVAVPTRGVERWLAQTLSASLGAQAGRGDGVCANVDFPPPGALLGRAVAAASGIDRDDDPWLPERALWPLLDVVDGCLGEPWVGALTAHLGMADPAAVPADDPRRDRRFAAVRHLAAAFDRYAVQRPAMLRAWAAGDDVHADGRPLPDDSAWQAELWRRLRARIGVDSPAERLPGACARLREDPAVSDLPARLALFGLTRLPASQLDVLAALAVHREVHLLLLHPSPALWAGVAASGHARGPIRRVEDLTAGTAANPLLGTWGRDARELQLVVGGARTSVEEHHHPLVEEPRTLLGHLQAHARADRDPKAIPAAERPLLDPADRSVQVHACHGRVRQVEVLRDAVLHLLADDPTLEPRDVIVMCPDIEAFAPLLHATFGAGDAIDETGSGPPGDGAGPAPTDLRVRLADRALRQTNPVLGAMAHLLELGTARVTASEVLDLAGREPVRRRFGFDDDDLARIEEWVDATGVRWGLDVAHRAPTRVALPDGTWRRGIDRVLVGVAAAEEGPRLVAGVLPLDDVDAGDIDLAGRLAELVDRLGRTITALSSAQPIAAWAAALSAAADALLAVADRDAWQRGQLQRILEELVAGSGGVATPLTPAELRDLLADRLRGRPTTASFRTGHLTVCTLHPMRSVPHRVVCLLGLDDGVFPRRVAPDGDDLVAREPHVGDRDPRSEDRQLLLDAVLAAGDHLVVTYAGRDERTNAPLPPAVPIGELLDVVDATVRTPDGSAPRGQVVTAHPLQPFDVRNFATGPAALVGGAPWSFDRTALAGARATVDDREAAPAFLDGPLPAPDGDLVELDALVRFVQHPVKAFLRRRLGVVLTEAEDELADALPVELGPLEAWALGQRLLDARLAGASPAAIRAAELARGTLPPGTLAQPALDAIGPVVDAITAVADGLLTGPGTPARSVGVALDLPDGRTLVGTVPGVRGDLVRAVTYSRVAPKHRLAAWVRLLALTAAHPERPWTAATVGRSGARHRDVAVARIPALGEDADARRTTALRHLAVLVDLHDRGMREPLPIAVRTSAAWAAARLAGTDPAAAATAEWTTTWRWAKEDSDLAHQQVLGGVAPLDALLAAAPREDEAGAGWPEEEPTRFGRCAVRLWSGLLAVEAVEDR
jgi:exodeoxyribonuclease V gamma subunit